MRMPPTAMNPSLCNTHTQILVAVLLQLTGAAQAEMPETIVLDEEGVLHPTHVRGDTTHWAYTRRSIDSSVRLNDRHALNLLGVSNPIF